MWQVRAIRLTAHLWRHAFDGNSRVPLTINSMVMISVVTRRSEARPLDDKADDREYAVSAPVGHIRDGCDFIAIRMVE